MTPVMIGIICLVVLFVLLILRMPIAITMAFIGFAGVAWLRGLDPAFGMLGSYPYETWSSYLLSVAPLFMLMGQICYYAGISTDLYDAANTLIGHVRGGLAIATVAGCAAFAAVSGSSTATAVTMGMVAIPEMKKRGYHPGLTTGVLAAGGTMGAMIPPSMGLIFYGIITEQSIGKLFLAGVIPGVLEAIFYIITIVLLCKVNPGLAPRGPGSTGTEKIKAFKKTTPVFSLFCLVIGGIYFGIFSPTEAAGIGAFGAFSYAVVSRKLSWGNLRESLAVTVKISAMVLFIVAGASMLNSFLALSSLPTVLGDSIGALPLNRYVILAFILSFYMILGCFMDPISMMLLTMPIFYPLITVLDFNPIWFGILITRVCEIGMITPPMGMNVFVIKGIAPDVKMHVIFRGIMPFLAADVLHLALLVSFPQIALFLPGLMSH